LKPMSSTAHPLPAFDGSRVASTFTSMVWATARSQYGADAIGIAAACRHAVYGPPEQGHVELGRFVALQQRAVELAIRDVVRGDVAFAAAGDGFAHVLRGQRGCGENEEDGKELAHAIKR
jgi:hypothetical protein